MRASRATIFPWSECRNCSTWTISLSRRSVFRCIHVIRYSHSVAGESPHCCFCSSGHIFFAIQSGPSVVDGHWAGDKSLDSSDRSDRPASKVRKLDAIALYGHSRDFCSVFSWFAMDFGGGNQGHITIVPDLSLKTITQSLSNPSSASLHDSISVCQLFCRTEC